MNKTGGLTKKRLGFLSGAVAVLLAVMSPRLAFAGNNNGTLTHVEYFYNGGTPSLLLQQNGNSGVNYWAQMVNANDSNGNPCSPAINVDIDTIKIWVSIAQAAELSGKSTTIYYSSTCNGTNYIQDVVMFN